MKEKILNALKTEYATLGLGEKALDGLATFLAKSVTEETPIDEAVKAEEVKALIKGFQVEPDRTEPAPSKDEHPGVEAYEARLAELERKWQETEKKAARAIIVGNVKSRLEKDCKDAPILRQVLKGLTLAEDETEDEAVNRLTAEYNATVKEIRGEGYVPPAGSGYQAPAYKGGDFRSEVERLRAEGKIPQTNS